MKDTGSDYSIKKNKDQEENMEAYYKSVADRLGVDPEAIKEFVAKNKKQ